MPKVRSFTDSQGVEHLPGEIVDLPKSYLGETWLEPVEPEPKVKVPPAKVEPAPVEVKPVPLEASKAPKKSKKAK